MRRAPVLVKHDRRKDKIIKVRRRKRGEKREEIRGVEESLSEEETLS